MYIALLFSLHPLNTMIVDYVFKRSEELALLFYLMSFLSFTEVLKNKKVAIVPALLSFIMAIFSKPNAVTLPAVILVFDYMKVGVLILLILFSTYSAGIGRKAACSKCKMNLSCPGSTV